MSADLHSFPRCDAEHLGLPMPDDRDAVSSCLPLWQHNIGYEEGDPDVVDRLQAAYPRFCIHPDVRDLCDRLFADEAGLPFVSQAAAHRAAEYVRFHGGVTAQIRPIPNQPCASVTVSADEFPLLKQYWQHAGELVSSRVARSIAAGYQVAVSDTAERCIVRQRVADLHQTDPSNVYLFCSGMAAIAATWRAISRWKPDSSTCQFGFPYVDTLKIQERFPDAQHAFLPMGDSNDVRELVELMKSRTFSSVFCETPTNPLLVTPDLGKLRTATSQHNALLVVDDTLRACSLHSVLPHCDVVVTSLTKYFSGYGNVLAGALVLNPGGQHCESIRTALDADFQESLSDLDVAVLERNSRDLRQRIDACVQSAQTLVERLRQHPCVDKVYYPSDNMADSVGRGALFSIVLKNAAQVTPNVFDRLRVSKGPNLGTNFTLCCPYTILAHYTELDFAEHCGASRWLLRFSIGLEPVEELWNRLNLALDAASDQ